MVLPLMMIVVDEVFNVIVRTDVLNILKEIHMSFASMFPFEQRSENWHSTKLQSFL